MTTATPEVVDIELAEAYEATLRFRAELQEWLESRVRTTGDRIVGCETMVKLDDGANCGHLILVDVVSDSGPVVRLTVDIPS
jgi:hypothetical protein